MHQKNQNTNNSERGSNTHIPVLLNEVLTLLNPQEKESYLDLTAGYGGHAREVIGRTLQVDRAKITLVDRDQNAVDTLKSEYDDGAEIIHSDFLSASEKLLRQGRRYNIILADLGMSSPHINNASRGFSLQQNGPLDMRMDNRQELTADEIVNNYDQTELEKIIRAYGEEPKAKRIAKLIVENRPLKSTTELATVVSKAWPGHSKSHPATRTFQAIRIAVNGELDQIQRALLIWKGLLAPGGRLGVISFHSLEDRIVKQFFTDYAGDRYDTDLQMVTKGPVVASETEIAHNPRARSAKLRVAVKK